VNTRHTDSECTHGSSWPHCFVSSKGRSFLLTSSFICIPRCLSYEDVVTLRTFDFISHALSVPLFGASCCVPKAQWKVEPRTRESPRPRGFFTWSTFRPRQNPFTLLQFWFWQKRFWVYWGPLTCLFKPVMLPAIDCQGASTLIFAKGGLGGERFANATPLRQLHRWVLEAVFRP